MKQVTDDELDRYIRAISDYSPDTSRNAKKKIRSIVRNAYIEADRSVLLRESIDDLNRRLIDAELDRDRWKQTAEQAQADLSILRASTRGACDHRSATGVDQTPDDDPSKVWRCDHCGLTWTQGGED